MTNAYRCDFLELVSLPAYAHSIRSAIIGSTRVARRAGTKRATIVTTTIVPADSTISHRVHWFHRIALPSTELGTQHERHRSGETPPFTGLFYELLPAGRGQFIEPRTP